MDDDDDDEEEAEAFMPTKANARKPTSDITNKDSNAAKLPAVMADDDHHQWETIETVVVNGQDVDVDAGVILGDEGLVARRLALCVACGAPGREGAVGRHCVSLRLGRLRLLRAAEGGRLPAGSGRVGGGGGRRVVREPRGDSFVGLRLCLLP